MWDPLAMLGFCFVLHLKSWENLNLRSQKKITFHFENSDYDYFDKCILVGSFKGI